jgi:uncharacterized repeat protein (TIGR01451 family)
MKRLINTVIVWMAFVGFAQAQSWYKTYSLDSLSNEGAMAMVTAAQGDIYLFSSEYEFGTTGLKYNIILRHIDKDGLLLFSKRIYSPVSINFEILGSPIIFSDKIIISVYNNNNSIESNDLIAVSTSGNLLWQKNYKKQLLGFYKNGSNIIIAHNESDNLSQKNLLTIEKLSGDGLLLKSQEHLFKRGQFYQNSIRSGVNNTTNLLFSNYTTQNEHFITLDSSLALKDSIVYPREKEVYYIMPIKSNNNSIVYLNGNGKGDSIVIKELDKNSKILKYREILLPQVDFFFIEKANDMNAFWLVGLNKINDEYWVFFDKYNFDGKLLFSKKENINKKGYTASFYEGSQNNLFLFGKITVSSPPKPLKGMSYIFKMDMSKSSFIGYLKGSIRKDANLNCKAEDTEQSLRGIPIRIVSPSDSFYVTSNEKGEYFANVSDSTAKVKVLASTYWTTCQDTLIWFKKQGEEKTLNLPLKPIINCPLLEVSLATQRLRRCFDNVYTLQYCNRGTATANNAYIDVDFDKWLTVKASSIPKTLVSGNKYRFALGAVQALDCGSFTVTVNVNCDSTVLGQTHCSTAHIYPDSACIVDNSWDKSSIAIQAKCNNGKVNLSIKNVGTAPTSQARQSIVIEDQIMFLQSPVNLNPGETKDLEFNPKGKTMRFMVEQAKNHPSRNAFVTTAVEGCGAASPSLGFVTQFGESDNEPWLDTDCRQNIGAYDPNDKSSSPLGYGALHQIEPNTEIEYQINFQNEGTDTAFTVVLRDTIDNNLNISTLQMGASSHPYTWELINRGTLKVTFNNIYLTTKKENEAKSQGFVRYRIAQHRDVALGKSIKNRAGIYFDFNPPIMTNTTMHLVSKNFVVVAVPDVAVTPLKVTVAPNPFHGQAIFNVENADNEPFMLQIFDTSGKVLHRQESSQQQVIYQNILPQGIYFYKITNEKGSASGKLMVL